MCFTVSLCISLICPEEGFLQDKFESLLKLYILYIQPARIGFDHVLTSPSPALCVSSYLDSAHPAPDDQIQICQSFHGLSYPHGPE